MTIIEPDDLKGLIVPLRFAVNALDEFAVIRHMTNGINVASQDLWYPAMAVAQEVIEGLFGPYYDDVHAFTWHCESVVELMYPDGFR